MKKATIPVVLSLLTACGASPEYLDAEDMDSDGQMQELGQAEQRYVALNSLSRQWGTQTGTDRLSCNKTSSGQVCSMARFLAIELARTSASWTVTENATISEVRNGLAFGFPNWTFTLVETSATPAANAVRLTLTKGTVSGSLTTTLNGYRSVSFGSTASLTEGQHPGLATPVGQYQRHGTCSATIDTTDINNRGADAEEDRRLLDHAVGSAAIICMGVGMRNDASGTWSQRTIDPSDIMNVATPGESCRATLGDTADQADFSVQTASICAD